MNNANIIAKIQERIGKAYVDYIPVEKIDKEYLKTLTNEKDIEIYLLTGIKGVYTNEEQEEYEEQEQKRGGMRYGYDTPTPHKYYQ